MIVDRNGFQANVNTEALVPLEPLEAKFSAFGCAVRRVDGHDPAALQAALAAFPYESTGGVRLGPSVLIADTVRGKGLPSLENRADRWFCNFTAAEIEDLVAELHGRPPAQLRSVPIVAR